MREQVETRTESEISVSRRVSDFLANTRGGRLATNAIAAGCLAVSAGITAELADANQSAAPIVDTTSTPIIHTDPIPAFDHCSAESLAGKPHKLSGQLKSNRRTDLARERFDWMNPGECRFDGQRKIKLWIEMESNSGKFYRNSRIKTYNADFDFKKSNDKFKLKRPYTCEPGPGKRALRLKSKVIVHYNGQRAVKNYSARAIGNVPSDPGITKC